MKKNIIKIIISFVVAACLLSIPAIADFGDYSGNSDYDYGGSYDYGNDYGSSYDYGSDYSYDYGSDDYYFSDYDSSDSPMWVVITIVVIIIVAIMFSKKGKQTKATYRPAPGTTVKHDDLTPIDKYTEIDPNFSSAALCEKASNLYVQMQNGWTAKNIESLRPYFTDAMFTQMERSLKGLIQRGETNHIERIAVMEVTPLGYRQSGGEDHIILRLRTRITDYTVNDNTQEVTSGSKDSEKFMTYEWDLTRPTGTTTSKDDNGGVKRIICPSCSAPLDINASARCPYCGTVIQQKAQDWVISAINGIKQETI